ncbi:MAG TPA: hypothetical protein DEA08_35710, partial [Planctomycetes bacterium]|nr:hypothetical protein [Planctomycetota bacterium]
DEGDQPRPFRAERQSRALAVENASLTLELHDLVSAEATFELASKGSELIRVEHSDMVQEIDPDAGWKVLYQGRPLKGLADTKERKFAKEKEIIFKRSEEEQARVFMIRHPQDKLSAPFSAFGRRKPRDPVLGVSCLADLRIREVLLEWQGKENAEDAAELRRALTERRLLAVEAEQGEKEGFVLARDQRERLSGFVLKGEWKASRSGLECEPAGQLWTTQFGDYGVFR